MVCIGSVISVQSFSKALLASSSESCTVIKCLESLSLTMSLSATDTSSGARAISRFLWREVGAGAEQGRSDKRSRGRGATSGAGAERQAKQGAKSNKRSRGGATSGAGAERQAKQQAEQGARQGAKGGHRTKVDMKISDILVNEDEDGSRDASQSCIKDALETLRAEKNTRENKESALRTLVSEHVDFVENAYEYVKTHFGIQLQTLEPMPDYEVDDILGYITPDVDTEIKHVLEETGILFDESYLKRSLVREVKNQWTIARMHVMDENMDAKSNAVYHSLYTNVNSYVRNLGMYTTTDVMFVHALESLKSKIIQFSSFVMKNDIARVDREGATIVMTCAHMIESILPYLQQYHPDYT